MLLENNIRLGLEPTNSPTIMTVLWVTGNRGDKGSLHWPGVYF